MKRRAFTLLEVLIAIALGLTLIAALFAFYWDLLGTRERLEGASSRLRAAAALVEGVDRDLTTAIVGDASIGAGVSGDASSLRILCRAVPVRLARDAASATTGGPFGDLERVEYRFSGNRLEARRRAVVVGATFSSGDFEPLGEGIGLVRFRYHDGSGWRDDFDSLADDRLPQAVEIAIWMDRPEGMDDAPADEPDFAAADDEAPDLDLAPPADDELPPPDRIRVIAIPDAGAGDDADDDAGDEERGAQ